MKILGEVERRGRDKVEAGGGQGELGAAVGESFVHSAACDEWSTQERGGVGSHGNEAIETGEAMCGSNEFTLAAVEEEAQVGTLLFDFKASAATVVVQPPRVMSSRYPMTMSLAREERRGWMVNQKSSGPRGSPCWTPSWDRIL